MVWVAPLLAQRSEYRGLGADSSFYSTVINQQYIRYILTLSGLSLHSLFRLHRTRPAVRRMCVSCESEPEMPECRERRARLKQCRTRHAFPCVRVTVCVGHVPYSDLSEDVSAESIQGAPEHQVQHGIDPPVHEPKLQHLFSWQPQQQLFQTLFLPPVKMSRLGRML